MKQFYFDKKILIYNIVYCTIYCLLTIRVWFRKPIWFGATVNLIIGGIMLLVFIINIVNAILLTIITYRKIPALIISEESIHYYRYGVTFYWKDVNECKLWNNMVVLDMNNPAYYIEKIKNPVRRVFFKIWYAIFRKKKFRIGLRVLDTDGGLIFNQFEKYDLLSQSTSSSL